MGCLFCPLRWFNKIHSPQSDIETWTCDWSWFDAFWFILNYDLEHSICFMIRVWINQIHLTVLPSSVMHCCSSLLSYCVIFPPSLFLVVFHYFPPFLFALCVTYLFFDVCYFWFWTLQFSNFCLIKLILSSLSRPPPVFLCFFSRFLKLQQTKWTIMDLAVELLKLIQHLIWFQDI